MSVTLRGGVTIGLLCALWTYVMGWTGWYRDPALLNLFWIVIVIEIAVLVWALRSVSSAGATYGGLVREGTLMALLGGVLIFIGSYLFTTVFFPEYFREIREISGEIMKAEGLSAEEIRLRLEAQDTMASPFLNALMGFLGTLLTGVLASALLGLVLRKSRPAGQA